MVNISAKFDEEIHNGFVAIMFTSLFPYMYIVTLTFDLNINRVHPHIMVNMSAMSSKSIRSLTMANMSAKFDIEIHTV